MPYLYFDWTILLVLGAAVIGFIAQSAVQSTYRRFAQVEAASRVTAAEAARRILSEAGVHDVRIEYAQGGTLSDHYDPRAKALRLSRGIYESDSIAALGIAAHEAGHAIQHANGYAPLKIRNAIVPVVSLGSNLAVPLLLVGLFLGFPGLARFGVILYGFAVVFQLITLPVELNASSRALYNLEASGLLTQQETPQARKVLSAAASTYMAAALISVAQLLRLMSIAGMNRRRD